MFWKMGFNTPSSIDQILGRDEYTLEDLLNDDDILQEVRNQNKKLVDYLAQPDIVQRLLGYVVEDGDDDADMLVKFKYPNIAAEVLTSECWPIMEEISKPESLDYLWRVVDKPAPLNPLLASFFSKVVSALLNKEIVPLTTYLLGKPESLTKLIGHLATPAIMDVLLKMASIETSRDDDSPNLATYWAADQKLVKVLLGLFNTSESGASDSILSNATILLGDLVTAGRKEAIEMQEFSVPSPFLQQLTSTELLAELLDSVLGGENTSMALEYALSFIASLLRETERGEEEAPPTEIDRQRYEAEVKTVLAALIPRVRELHALLLVAPSGLLTASGELVTVCGNTRLQVAGAFEALLRSPTPEIEAIIIELQTLPILLDLFKDLPHNNLYHAQISSIVIAIIGMPHDGPGSELRRHMFTDCKLLTRLMDMVTVSHAMKAKTNAHADYYGYLIKMGNAVQSAVLAADKNCDPLATYLESDSSQVSAWGAYVKEHLDPENDRMRLDDDRPQDGGDYTSDDDDDDDWGNEAEAAFTRYLNDRINVDVPDSYGIDDDESDDSDEGSYGVSAVYSADFTAFNTELPSSASAGASMLAMEHPTASNTDDGGSTGSRPLPVEMNSDAVDPFGTPTDQSTPLETDASWAAFGSDSAAPTASTSASVDSETGAKTLTLSDGSDLTESSDVNDSEVPKGSVDIDGGGNIFSSSV